MRRVLSRLIDHGNEKVVLRICLIAFIALYALDLATDFEIRATPLHFTVDILFGLIAFVSLIILGYSATGARRQAREFQSNLVDARSHLQESEFLARTWEERARDLKLGIGESIEREFKIWKLSESEKEIALFLLKGLSVREIAGLRNTSEKTVRHQALAVYAKAGVSGRAELAAYFLEDLLAPIEEPKETRAVPVLRPADKAPHIVENINE